jgi:hypothetical protein
MNCCGWPPSQSKRNPANPSPDHFLYVIRGDHNMSKVGVTTNPSARLAQLRTASAFPLDFSYLAVTPGTGFDIEQGAHAMLASHRCNGEWFDVQPEIAVAAIAGAAHKLNQPLLPVTADVAERVSPLLIPGVLPVPEQILRIAANGGKVSQGGSVLGSIASILLRGAVGGIIGFALTFLAVALLWPPG